MIFQQAMEENLNIAICREGENHGKRDAEEGYNKNKLHFSMPAAPFNKQLRFSSNPISLAANCWQKDSTNKTFKIGSVRRTNKKSLVRSLNLGHAAGY
jgi:hypothetical protein